jgi:hypothetical protein
MSNKKLQWGLLGFALLVGVAAVSTDVTSFKNAALSGYLSLSGETNRLTVAGDALLLDGSAIGGDTIWNNTDGVIAPASGQNTNVLRFTSGLADNFTNAAVVVNTTVEWPHGSLLKFFNNDAEQAKVTASGAVSVGGQIADDYWGGWGEAGEGFLSVRDANISGYTAFYVVLTDTNDPPANAEFFGVDITTNGPALSLGINQAVHASMEPGITATSTPYKFGTSLSHTSGLLGHFQNNSTNKFSVAWDGATTIAQSATEPAAPAAGYFTLFGIDNGGGKMILKVRFPTGASQTIATEP